MQFQEFIIFYILSNKFLAETYIYKSAFRNWSEFRR